MHFTFAFVISFPPLSVSVPISEESFPNAYNMPLNDLGSRKETLAINSFPCSTARLEHLEDSLRCQELPSDKRKSDEKKGNLGADRLKAKISPGISGYKRGFCISQRTPDHINLFK